LAGKGGAMGGKNSWKNEGLKTKKPKKAKGNVKWRKISQGNWGGKRGKKKNKKEKRKNWGDAIKAIEKLKGGKNQTTKSLEV